MLCVCVCVSTCRVVNFSHPASLPLSFLLFPFQRVGTCRRKLGLLLTHSSTSSTFIQQSATSGAHLARRSKDSSLPLRCTLHGEMVDRSFAGPVRALVSTRCMWVLWPLLVVSPQFGCLVATTKAIVCLFVAATSTCGRRCCRSRRTSSTSSSAAIAAQTDEPLSSRVTRAWGSVKH